jgi:hypothetical protein
MKIQSSDELYRLLHLYVYYVMGKRSQRYGLSLSSLSVAEMRFFFIIPDFWKRPTESKNVMAHFASLIQARRPSPRNHSCLWLILPCLLKHMYSNG